MKHHGNYTLPTPEELMLDDETGCAQQYVTNMLHRHRHRLKYKNQQRHRQKRKSYYGDKRTK